MDTWCETEAREAAYWDTQAAHWTDDELCAETLALDALDHCCLAGLGDVAGKRLLDVGCGAGLWSVSLAHQGAKVWAIDISPESIGVTTRRASLHGVADRVHAAVMSATALRFPDGCFDLVFGRDILHHVDAAALGREVVRVLAPGGRAVFSENCANNRLLMFARDRLCGRWGIPKWSSDDEYPLTRENVVRFSRPFAHTEVHYPRIVFFHYLDAKFFGYNNRLVNRLCRTLDTGIYRLFPALRQYSYRQVICCCRS